VTPDELGRLFVTFKTSAFRLECLPVYDVTEDDEGHAFRLWQAGESQPVQDRDWPKLCRSAVGAGKKMQRVRVVQSSLTEYQRFQLAWGYPANVAAGEDIRILTVESELPPDIPWQDYWLFDDAIAVILEYDDKGRFLRPVIVEDVTPYRRGASIALTHAEPFESYRASLPS
jgi:hypothetical protein